MDFQRGKRYTIDIQARDHREAYEAEYFGPLYTRWGDDYWEKQGEYFFCQTADGSRHSLMVHDDQLPSAAPLD